MKDCHCQAWDEGRVLVILETGHDPGPAHAQPDWVVPCHGEPGIFTKPEEAFTERET